MIKYFKGILFISILSGCSHFGSKDRTSESFFLISKIQIDGIEDPQWKAANSTFVKNITICKVCVSDTFDLSARFKTAWDDQYLYFYVVVNDDIKFSNQNNKDNLMWSSWKNDDLEFFFKSSNASNQQMDTKPLRLDFVYGIDTIISSNDIKRFKYAFSDTKYGYDFEIAIPWENIDVKPKEGLDIPFELTISDNDNIINEDGIISWAQSKISLANEKKSVFYSKEMNYNIIRLNK